MRSGRGWLCVATLALAAGAPACKTDKIPPRNRLWQQVVEWAEPDVPDSPHDKLAAAVTALRGNDDISEIWRGSPTKDPAPAEPDEVAVAVDALLEWRKQDGGIERGRCGDPEMLVDSARIDLLTLARAALLWAPGDPSHPRVEAALYLGHRLRREGHSLLDVMIGLAIATDAVDWAKSRGLSASDAYRELAPRSDLPARAYAAEAVCTVAMLDTLLGDPERARKELGGKPIDLLQREVERVRYFNQQLVHGIHSNVADRATVQKLVARQFAQASEQDDPLGLFRMMAGSERMIGNIYDDLERYRSFLRGKRAD